MSARRHIPEGLRAAVAAVLLAVPAGLQAQAAELPPAAPTPVPTAPGKQAAGAKNAQTPAVTDSVHGQAESEAKVSSADVAPSEPAIGAGAGALADQVIAVVNGDLILESDVREEERFENFEPFSAGADRTRDKAIERLIDRALILQQAKLQPDMDISDAQVNAQLASLRKDLPACKQYACDTDAGWERFIHDQGFTLPELQAEWKQRMKVLKFIELRFRAGIEITPDQIKNYYQQTMLPAYAKNNQKPPKLAVLSDRIQDVLLEQQVSALLSDWLQSLKAEGSVRVIRPGEVQP